eukprot:TRINITY_DN7125_c0_g2_i15.p1 TRINITY_DN7125_c0_g2~~TRINITY_DN7125_c0_g2_i15.p1  ORF type:complete len:405 (-),score=56.96 TRINITY_DN7125_c0_g2_i15:21-1235(-)
MTTISCYCKIALGIIVGGDSAGRILAEYIKRWNAFAAAIIELDRNLKVISDLVNMCYANLFPDLQEVPKFTVTRAMATIWKTKVFDKLKDILFTSFRTTLFLQRQQQAKELRSKKGKLEMDFFSDAKSGGLLGRFVQSVADISVNEVKIHMLGSTKFAPDEAYTQLQEAVLEDTRRYYREIDVMKSGRELKEVMEKDLKFVSKLVLPVTRKHIHELSHECAKKLIRTFVKEELRQYLQKGMKACDKHIDSHTYPQLYNYVKGANSVLSDSELQAWYYNSFCVFYENLARLYEHVMMERKVEEGMEDVVIEYQNERLKIPTRLTPQEAFFYKYSRDVTLKSLQEISRKNAVAKKRLEVEELIGFSLSNLTCFIANFYRYLITLSLIHICRCRRYAVCRSRWSPYH